MTDLISDERIAIVGISAIFPGALNAHMFWQNIVAGKDFVQDVPRTHWLKEDYFEPTKAPDKVYTARGAFLPDVPFDPIEFGVPPNTLSATDTQQLLALIAAKKVLNDAASVQFNRIPKERISVILGVAAGNELMVEMSARIQQPVWANTLREYGLSEQQVSDICERLSRQYAPWTEATFPGLLGNVIAGRIANRLNLCGTNFTVDAACASSLAGLKAAIDELLRGDSDLVITGGTDAFNDIFMYMCFSQTPALSATGDCRPFSADADGTILGEGLGMVALRRLADAERDGDTIYAVIRSIGASSDGLAKSVYAPLPTGQARAIQRAFDRSGFSPREIELLEAHGTGTKAGDAAEFEGLQLAFSECQETQFCALGSIKSQIGHTKSAAGSAALLKAALALHHKLLPPTIKVSQPNPKLAIETSAFYLNTQARPWIHTPKTTRKAGVSSFGFGGSNFHVILEEYVGSAANTPLRFHTASVALILLSASDHAALQGSLETLLTQLQNTSTSLQQLARASQLDFSKQATHRLALLLTDHQQGLSLVTNVLQKLKTQAQHFALAGQAYYRTGLSSGMSPGFLFSGHEAPTLNSGAELAMEFDVARAVWDRASDYILNQGETLAQVCFPIPVFSTEARQTQNERLAQAQWAQPAVGVQALAQCLLLQSFDVQPAACAGIGEGELLALYTAGALTEEADLFRLLKKRGELSMPQASDLEQHNTANAWSRALDSVTFSSPKVPVYTPGVEAGYPEKGKAVRRLFAQQWTQPSTVSTSLFQPLYQSGVRIFVELGGDAFSRAAQTLPDDAVIISLGGKKQELAAFWEALAQLAVWGVSVSFEKLWQTFVPFENPFDHSAYSPAMRLINGANVGKPYPSKERQAGLLPVKPSVITEPVIRPPVQQPLSPPIQTQAPRATRPAPALPQVTTLSSSRSSFRKEKLTMKEPIHSSAWLTAFQTLQQNMLDAHTQLQASLLQSHTQFLQITERAFEQLGIVQPSASASVGLGSPALARESTLQPVPTVVSVAPVTAPVFSPAAAVAPVSLAPRVEMLRPMSPAAAPASHLAQAMPSASPSVAITPSIPPAPAILPSAAPAPASSSTVSIEKILLEVIAEKTGYPEEMLDLDADLESGLGIDSIKRVEILSALQTKIPQLSKVETTQLSELNTLRAILDFASAEEGGSGAASSDAKKKSTDMLSGSVV